MVKIFSHIIWAIRVKNIDIVSAAHKSLLRISLLTVFVFVKYFYLPPEVGLCELLPALRNTRRLKIDN